MGTSRTLILVVLLVGTTAEVELGLDVVVLLALTVEPVLLVVVVLPVVG